MLEIPLNVRVLKHIFADHFTSKRKTSRSVYYDNELIIYLYRSYGDHLADLLHYTNAYHLQVRRVQSQHIVSKDNVNSLQIYHLQSIIGMY